MTVKKYKERKRERERGRERSQPSPPTVDSKGTKNIITKEQFYYNRDRKKKKEDLIKTSAH